MNRGGRQKENILHRIMESISFPLIVTIVLIATPVTTAALAQEAEGKRMAARLFGEGVDLHNVLEYHKAVRKYKEALSHWQSPKIYLYLSMALTKIGEPVEAYENLLKATSMTGVKLQTDDRERFEALRAELLREHLAVIEIPRPLPGAEVTLDGEPLSAENGVGRRVVRARRHVLAVERTGYFPIIENIPLKAGDRATVTLTMSRDELLKNRRWGWWTPWVVVGAGAGAALVGGVLLSTVRSTRNRYDRVLSDLAFGVECSESSTLGPLGILDDRIAVGILGAGGIVLAGGVVLAFLNQPRSSRSENRSSARFNIKPIINASTTGVSAQVPF